MAKSYPLEICILYDIDDGNHMGIYSKGHHDPIEFCKEATIEAELDEGEFFDPLKVRQLYGRWEMMTGPDGPIQVLAEHYETGRGIFPITYIDY